MEPESLADRAETWVDAQLEQKLTKGGIMHDVLWYLIVFLTCFVTGTLLLRVVHVLLRSGRRGRLARRRTGRAGDVPRTKRDRVLGRRLSVRYDDEQRAGTRRKEDRVVNGRAVPDVGDSCILK
jgi:hypothetical protein